VPAAQPRHRNHSLGGRAFTLIEVLVAMVIFAGVLAAIYSSWTAILRSSDAVRGAAAEAQRSRMGIRALEEGLASAQFFAANARHYAFLADTGGEHAALSFVAKLPRSFPRGGRFGDQTVRRLTFNVEEDASGRSALMLRQTPLLFESDIDETEAPLVLARNLLLFHLEFWGPNSREWEPEWPFTNQLPRLVRFSLAAAPEGANRVDLDEVISRVIVLPLTVSGPIPGGIAPPLEPGGAAITNLIPGSPIPPTGSRPERRVRQRPA
jgi:prepilin-type N-terminal cleavage/methylation domain-containing protein